ncbi:hypothetical protein BR93DRAFT_930238 [Coniochaeta sp. PMI_546]|nr:hypothetical protein BR93DRAFT_930238 [Coniochaeta sp. PMI_546]
MVFDPLSIIGYVGTAAGLVGFLVSTVTRLEQYKRDFQGAASKLRWYEIRLTSIDGELTAWGRLWCGGYSEDDYEYFWTPGGFASVRDIMSLIHHEINEIGLLIYRCGMEGDDKLTDDCTDQDWGRWKLHLAHLRRIQNTYSPRTDLISRIFFSSFRGANLEERLTRLEKMVSLLKTDSQRMLLDIQFRPTASHTVNGDVLQRVMDRKDWLDEHEAILARLYTLSERWGDWSLVLRLPDEQGRASSIDDGNGIKVEFDVQSTSKSGQRMRELGIIEFYPSRFARDNPAITVWYQQMTRVAKLRLPTREDYFVARFTLLRRREPDLRRRLAEAAIGLVNWTMLLWNTPWTEGICSCRLRFIRYQQDNDADITVATFAATTTCMKTAQVHVSNKSLSMGISLAELALRQQVIVHLDESGRLRFSLDGKAVTETELLDRVKMKNGPGYRSAVWYCFKHSKELACGEGFRPHDIIAFEENVIKRLETYMKGC